MQGKGSAAAVCSWGDEWSQSGREALCGATPSQSNLAVCLCAGPGRAKQLVQNVRCPPCLAQGEEETWQCSSRGLASGGADVLRPLFWPFVFRKCELGFCGSPTKRVAVSPVELCKGSCKRVSLVPCSSPGRAPGQGRSPCSRW